MLLPVGVHVTMRQTSQKGSATSAGTLMRAARNRASLAVNCLLYTTLALQKQIATSRRTPFAPRQQSGQSAYAP